MPRDETAVCILDGSTFVVSDARGDFDAGPQHPVGFFYRDTRFLSRWCLTIDGRRPKVLSTDDVDYFSAQFFLIDHDDTLAEAPSLSIIRQRFVGDGLHEDVILLNHGDRARDIFVRLSVDADFADLFEIKDRIAKVGRHDRRAEATKLVLGYRREQFVVETHVRATPTPEIDDNGLAFRVTLEPGGRWDCGIDVLPEIDGRRRTPKYARDSFQHARPNMRQSLANWLDDAPSLECDWQPLETIYRNCLVDLAALRFYPEILPDRSVPAAGLPWFMALFGRDSLIASYQALPFVPELAESTLRVLAARQATEVDDFRDAEPGKILHELRFGELTVFGDRPHSPYYGTADATPLFLILLEELERWTGNAELVRELEPTARAALEWIDRWGDRDGDGYVEYERRQETGLENQCWKDSWDAIRFSDGSLASTPIAVCEVQGYVYDAKRRCARLARDVWDDRDLGQRLELEADELKARFNEDFWIPDRGFFALAIDGEGRLADSLTSNIGHLLWSGIVDVERAAAIADHLVGDGLFSGWGVRTMAQGEGGYNPIGYHTGTVWPHDTSIVAAGLSRYGYRAEAARIGMALLEAATHFHHYRVPEVFAGYTRTFTHFPVAYPTASSPQAWAAAAPLNIIRALLGLEAVGGALTADPALPRGISRLTLRAIPGRWGQADIAASQPARASR